MKPVDLGSDTSSMPTEAMREAMGNAEVGNDGLGQDPTVNRLEQMAAERLGKEAGLFVSSGTMGNLIALMAFVSPGMTAVIGAISHIAFQESATLAQFSGIATYPIEDHTGYMDVEALEELFSRRSLSQRIEAFAIENTHNAAGGVPLSPDDIAQYAKIAQRYGVKLHIDGARIFNAAVALGVEAKELSKDADSITFCLSKGLCAPVGSVLVSDRETIRKGRMIRNQLGGQMRQVGIIAAAGIVALEHMVDRLQEDHEKASRLAKGIAAIPGIRLDPDRVRTNIVIFDVSDLQITAPQFCDCLKENGLIAYPFSTKDVRYVTWRDVPWEEVERAVQITEETACRLQ